MKFLRFLVSRVFLINLGIAILITALLYFLTFKMLDVFTRHGKEITLPNYIGMTLEELDNYSINKQFEFVIIDSIYDESKDKGSIVMQDPPANSQVKSGRKIYLTIIALLPERVIMPDLKDYSLRQAVSLLETYGLKTGILEFVESEYENAVLEQLYKGDTIHPDTLIIKGSKIDLIVGKGKSKVPVPFLIGMTRTEAVKTLNMSSLNIGKLFYLDMEDPYHSRIYDQRPAFGNANLREMGSTVDLWLRSDENFDFDNLIQMMQPDTIAVDTASFIDYDLEIIEADSINR